MSVYVQVECPDGSTFTGYLDSLPDTCPFCGQGVEFVRRGIYATEHRGEVQAILRCPRNDCRRYVMALYQYQGESQPIGDTRFGDSMYGFSELLPASAPSARDLGNEIKQVSSAFVEIYNQAYVAEQLGLDQLAGVGYRKALEFLIKDFAIAEHPDTAEEIRASWLGTCIRDYVDDPRIQNCASRAAWLGNDETHYTRRWADKDIEDLKILIDLTVYWVSSVLLTGRYMDEMPDA